MAYNKAREERKWRMWKDAEENQMRQLGVSQDVIEQLRVYDRAIFNSERRYYEKLQETGIYLEMLAENISQDEIKTVVDFLKSIEDKKLYQALLTVDGLTLRIVLMKIHGYTTAEIATTLGLTSKSVYRRIDRLKQKIKNLNT